MTTYDKDQVVAELAARFPDADPGPAGLWGFVNAGWCGDVDAQGLEDWAAAWQEAEAETLGELASEHEDDCYEDEGEAAYGRD